MKQDEQSGQTDNGRTSSNPIDFRNLEIVELLKINDVSVRLENAIMAAANAGHLSLVTIGEYIDAGNAAPGILLREVRNFGLKTARELDHLIHAQRKNCPDDELEYESPEESIEQLLKIFSGDTLSSISADEILSARLDNIMRGPPFDEMSFIQVLESFPRAEALLLRTPNCGRKSLREFREVCTRHILRRLTEFGRNDPRDLTRLLSPSRQIVAARVDMSSARSVEDLSSPEHDSIEARLDWLMQNLTDRATDILKRRNGIGQKNCETLEEIGSSYGVTRERIRQIEAKSIKQLRKHIRRTPIEGLLMKAGEQQWNRLSDGGAMLLKPELYDRRNKLDGHVRLALDILDLSLEQWFDTIGQCYPGGWLAPDQDKEAVEAAGNLIESELDRIPLPSALRGVVGDQGIHEASLAAELILKRPIREGYIMPSRVGVRLTRVVRLHSLLKQIENLRDIAEIVPIYHSLFPSDSCNERDAEIVMSAAPHLFLEVEEANWVAIGEPGTRFDISAETEIVSNVIIETEGTIAYALQSALAALGPTRLSDLMNEAERILPDGRSVNSIGPVLLMRRELFVRALPGVYALPEQVQTLLQGFPTTLPLVQNAYQARLYALARYAGEVRAVFPLWTLEAEYRICRWAKHSGDKRTYNSLLSIAEIEQWPCSIEEQANWKNDQRQKGRFELGISLRCDTAYNRPTLERLAAACFLAHTNGGFNWMAANRLIGRQIDSHRGAGLVALLIALGAIREPDGTGYRWQQFHPVTFKSKEIFDELTSILVENGSIEWIDPIGMEIQSRVLAATYADETWVDSVALNEMLKHDGNDSESEAYDDPLEQLMADQRKSKDAERREATLQWLLED